jgi:hypothetical protein
MVETHENDNYAIFVKTNWSSKSHGKVVPVLN